MQILPTTSQSILSLTDSYFIGADFSGSAGDSFAEELARQQEARDAVAQGESHSVQSVLDSTPQVTPLSQAPYNLTTDNGVTYTADEVLFTQNELKDLERDLRRQGAPEESLEELKKLSDQPGGSSLSEVMAALSNQRDYPSLNKEERDTLKALTNKLDPSGDLYSDIRQQLNGHNGQGALNSLINAMDNLQGQGTVFTQKEISLLTKALGLSDPISDQIMGQFGNNASLTLNKEGLSALLAPAQSDFNLEAANKKKLSTAVDATLAPLMQEARERMAAEKSASELSSRESEQRKVMIEKTVLENVNNNLENARAKHLETPAVNPAEKQMDKQVEKQADKNILVNTEGNKLMDKLSEKTSMQNESSNATDAKLDAKLVQDKEFSKDMQQQGDAQQQTQENPHSLWGQAIDKSAVRSEAKPVSITNNITTPVIGIGGLSAGNAQQIAQNLANAQQAQRNQMASQAASQVEKAMLTAAKDGSKSLELQLHPAELGSLNITLTARNGEVSAIIRSERSETAEILHKQMEHIRSQLEEQGVKVDKIEVRQGSQENTASQDSWKDAQYNQARQEENAQKELMERLRNLGKVRNDNTNISETALERNMHSTSSSAGNAAQSLYIVA